MTPRASARRTVSWPAPRQALPYAPLASITSNSRPASTPSSATRRLFTPARR
ncbi:hypothetical protein NKG94_27005 [Micromonospora sp. M12]